MVVISEDDSEEVEKKKEGDNPMDEQYITKRYEQKLEAMKRTGRKMKDMSIVIAQKGETVARQRDWKSAPERVRRDLTEREGIMEYATGNLDAPVEICIQSLSARPSSPSRVSLRVTQQSTPPEQRKKEQEIVKAKLSRMGQDLAVLEKKVDLILTNADYAKEQEVDFHEQSIAMNRASQYWPMIHLLVLLVTGFTQANHIVRFFKTHHIY